MEERRKYIRIPEDSQITYKVVAENKLGEHMIRDISQGGIRFLVHEFIPKDSYMKISLKLHKSTVAIEALVRIVWVKEMPSLRQYEVGVQFLDIPPKAFEYLVKYIRLFLDKKEK